MSSESKPDPLGGLQRTQATPNVETALHAERRQLTVAFIDIVGSTPLSERIDPEEFFAVIRTYRDICDEQIRHYGGHIARMIGDGLLAFFGVPQAHENDPERAVRASLAIAAAIKEHKFLLSDGSFVRLGVRIGVNTGVVVVGHVPGEPGTDMRDRLVALRYGYPALELLPSLDDLRERITLYLSAAQPGQVPALAHDAAEPVAVPSAPAHRVAPPADHPDLRGKHVLVIDDDARNVFAISSTLELHDLRVTQASDGRRGIAALRAAPDTDLILMDVMMPGMDGYATMTAIRQMPEFGRLPIIAVTARAMPGDREKSLAAGANDYVTKPVDTEELLISMERWLSNA